MNGHRHTTGQARTPALFDKRPYLEISDAESDMGNLVGKDPRQIPAAEIRLLELPETPLKAIRAKCIDCSGGNPSEARKCIAVRCPLWPMRMGSNPFHASSASNKLDFQFQQHDEDSGKEAA